MFRDCYAELANGVLTLGNSRVRRDLTWNEGHPVSTKLTDLAGGRVWDLSNKATDCVLPGDARPADGQLQVNPCLANAVHPAYLQVEATSTLGALQLRRVYRIYPGCPAMACDFYLRGRAEGEWQAELPDAAKLANIESSAAARQGQVQAIVIERIAHGLPHTHVKAAQFFDVTDRNNNLVRETTAMPYRSDLQLVGNVLLLRDPFTDNGVVILKEAPCSNVQLAWPGCDFVVRQGEVRVVGIGVLPEDLNEREWTRCYGVVTGVASGGELGLLAALRQYQRNVRVQIPERDYMILINTWGDRSQDSRVCEPFTRAELAAGERLGATHLQLDDGWQAGRSSNSAFGGGTLQDIWTRDDYWVPHPERFPNGICPLVAEAAGKGIQLGLWFNPSRDDGYANWQRDADVLVRLYRECGVRTFKIDGVDIPDRRAETNLRAMFDRVLDATDGDVVFNLDVTAGHRFGYHYFNEYGNVFVENRYTDWSNYYPHWTLRNLWMLSRYVPPRGLQIEVLNRWRNPQKYGAGDPLAPVNVPFDYCFAIAMVAQPLLWFESSNLPGEGYALGDLVRTYREHKNRIHDGLTFPIGDEPSGVGWTGFQSIHDDGGYVLIFREYNQRTSARIELHGLAGRDVSFHHVLGHGCDVGTTVHDDGTVEFALPEPLTFALFEYSLSGDTT